MISLIIPTKNEEKYLPKTLHSIYMQKPKDLEVIVADARSTDKTRDIAGQYGCKVVEGGHPGEGRNNGAKASMGDILMFQDADLTLPPGFLHSALDEFYGRGLDVAGTLQTPIITENKSRDFLYHLIYEGTNRSMKAAQNTKRPLMQNFMIARRKVHQKIGGFDETLEFGEDSEYAKTAVERGYKFGILETPEKALISPRRFEGREVRMLLKNGYFLAGMFLGHQFKRGNGRTKYF
jgi:glycosyltransferase involved in cell wall biosynthesis